MKSFFENIAIEFNGEYKYFEKVPQNRYEGYELSHHLTIKHKKHIIELVQSLSPDPCGFCSVEFTLKNFTFELEVTTRSHFMTLFSSSRNRTKVNCDSIELKSFIKSNKFFLDLIDISKESQFEPSFFSEINNNNLIVRAEYNLLFVDKTEVVKPILKFFIDLIDEVIRLDKYKRY